MVNLGFEFEYGTVKISDDNDTSRSNNGYVEEDTIIPEEEHILLSPDIEKEDSWIER